MLGMIKHDNMRWVFAVTLARFSDSILNYMANIDRASDKSITVARFSQSMYSAFEVLFNVWLNAKEVKLRLAVVEALGVMSHILVREKLEEIVPRLVPGMLSLYKKFTSDMLPLTQVRRKSKASWLVRSSGKIYSLRHTLAADLRPQKKSFDRRSHDGPAPYHFSFRLLAISHSFCCL